MKHAALVPVLCLSLCAVAARAQEAAASAVPPPPQEAASAAPAGSDGRVEMARAMAHARATLPQFLQALRSGSPDIAGFGLRVSRQQDGRQVSFWTREVREEPPGHFTAKIGMLPHGITGVDPKRPYRFGQDEVVDWMYIDKARHRMVGNFTLCATLTTLPEAQAQVLRERAGVDCNY